MTLFSRKDLPFELFVTHIIEAEPNQLIQISSELGLALRLDEMKAIQKYFLNKKRNPTDVELQSIGQTWSEHCFHKTFKGDIITAENRAERSLLKYITQSTEEIDMPWCLDVFSDNAGIVEFERGHAIAVKVETHNHPSAIEPFGGAATGIGGVIRDILGVWAKPIALTDVLCFGPLDHEYDKLPSGSKHPKYLYGGVVSGIGHYGNNMGIPTVNGAIFFDEGYLGNIVVFCGCIGILPMAKFVRATKVGDNAVLVGGKTGRDGIHGVTFASAELTEKSEKISRPAVQIANPIEEEKVKRAILEIRDRELCSGITDLGGGGLSCATGEMAYRSNCGIHVDLERVHLKYMEMNPWEIWISESQERMLVSVSSENTREVLDVFSSEDVKAIPIGSFTSGNSLRVDYKGVRVANLDLNFLFDPPRVKRMAKWVKPTFSEPSFPEPIDLTPYLLKLLSAPNIASKESVIRTYDHEVQGNTVLKPLQGRHNGPNDAAVIKPLSDSWRGISISCGMNPKYGKIDPYWMAASSIDEAIRNNISVGGRRIALLDNFTWGNPEKSDRLGGLVRAARACYDYAKFFSTPFISGKDSLYNESPLGPVTPTLLITALGIVPDVRKTVSVDIKNPGNLLYIVGKTYPELGGSEYYMLNGFIGKSVPIVRPEAKRTMEAVTATINAGYVKACHDVSEGGLAVAIAEMMLSGGCGVELHSKIIPRSNFNRDDHLLFSESNSRFLLEVHERYRDETEELLSDISHIPIGRIKRGNRLSIYGLNDELVINASSAELSEAWKGALGG